MNLLAKYINAVTKFGSILALTLVLGLNWSQAADRRQDVVPPSKRALCRDLLANEPRAEETDAWMQQTFPGASENLMESRRVIKQWLNTFDAYRNGDDLVLLSIPSMTLDWRVLEQIQGISVYESRGMMRDILITALNPRIKKLVLVSSTPLEVELVRFYVEMIVPASLVESVMDRIILESAEDQSSRPLDDKIAENFALQKRLRAHLSDENVIMETFITTASTDRLAEILGQKFEKPTNVTPLDDDETMPLVDDEAMRLIDDDEEVMPLTINGNPFVNPLLESKSSFHKVAERAGVDKAEAVYDIYTEEKFYHSVFMMLNASHHKLMLKHNTGTSGLGNASMDFTDTVSLQKIQNGSTFDEVIEDLKRDLLDPERGARPVGDISAQIFIDRLIERGGVVEQFIPNILKDDHGRNISPSAQVDGTPVSINIVSVTDQKFKMGTSDVFEGALYPASPEYADLVYEAGYKLAVVLRQMGYIGRFSADTVVTEDPETGELKVVVVEINPRRGGTHPIDVAILISSATRMSGEKNYSMIAQNKERERIRVSMGYESTDNYLNAQLKNFNSLGQLLHFLKSCELQQYMWDPMAKRGVIPHMLTGYQNGKIGFTAIGHGRDDAHNLFKIFKRNLTKALSNRNAGRQCRPAS